LVKYPYRLIVFLFFFVIYLNTAARAQFFFNNQNFTTVPASQADPAQIALSDELSDEGIYYYDENANHLDVLSQKTDQDEIKTKNLIVKFRNIPNKRLNYGYDNGLWIESKNGNYRTRMTGLLQLQYSLADSDDEDADSEFQVRRLRLKWDGHLIRPWLHYVLQISADNQFDNSTDTSFEGFKLKDLYVDLAYNIKYVPRIGEYKVPFNRDALSSGKSLLLIERSTVSNEFTWGRDRGVGLYGQIGSKITYGAAITSGNGVSGLQDTNLDIDQLLYSGRIQYQPCCGKLEFSNASFPAGGDFVFNPKARLNKTPTYAVGAAMVMYPNLNIGDKNPDNNIDQRFGELGITKGDVFSMSADFAYEYYRYTFETEFDIRFINPDQGSSGSSIDYGFTVQGGYHFLPPYIQIAGLFSYLKLDTDKDVVENFRDSSIELMTGLNFYLPKINRLTEYTDWRLQISYTFNRLKDIDDEDNLNILRIQLQTSF